MNSNEALGIISTVCKEFNGNLADHTNIQTALKVVADYADYGNSIKVERTAADDLELIKLREVDADELAAYREADKGPEIIEQPTTNTC